MGSQNSPFAAAEAKFFLFPPPHRKNKPVNTKERSQQTTAGGIYDMKATGIVRRID